MRMNLKSKAWVTLKEMKDSGSVERIFVDYWNGNLRSVAVSIIVEGVTYQGLATVNPKDKYVKELGREIAAGRCLKNLGNGISIPKLDDCPF